jgi:hypothetical protein
MSSAKRTQEADIILDDPRPSAGKTCPYHRGILALKIPPPTRDKHDTKHEGQTPVGRFLNDKPNEQCSVIALANGKLNIAKGCTCAQGVKKVAKARM